MKIVVNREKSKLETNRQYAYHILRENIMNLTLLPGSIIDEPLLLQELQISRTPLREALYQLKDEYLVEILPQKESRISFIQFPLVHEAFYLRSTVEPYAIQSAGEVFTLPLKAKLQQNLIEQEISLTNKTKHADFFHLDNEFHRLIYTSCGLEHLWENIQMLSTHYDRLRYLDTILGTINLAPLYISHQEIFTLLEENKTQKIDKYVKNHLSGYLKTKAFLYPEFKEYFTNL